ncbi:hypothetical protein SELMODRAFT_420091 [Selaginella moellendorffii]|uniref:Uncharacterized protein n=1 Tax=Selaginella moellendorffii TaxID=88036 RepID=D8SAI7_SELML|nr:hypothetical protein SELMODRAFT_420091 [Selaginella moellendorffii]
MDHSGTGKGFNRGGSDGSVVEALARDLAVVAAVAGYWLMVLAAMDLAATIHLKGLEGIWNVDEVHAEAVVGMEISSLERDFTFVPGCSVSRQGLEFCMRVAPFPLQVPRSGALVCKLVTDSISTRNPHTLFWVVSVSIIVKALFMMVSLLCKLVFDPEQRKLLGTVVIIPVKVSGDLLVMTTMFWIHAQISTMKIMALALKALRDLNLALRI